jgi:hypothetical protein
MELIHIVRTRHVQSINNVHRLNMGVKSKNFRIVKEQAGREGHAKTRDCRLLGARKMVEPIGIEPMTSCLQSRRSPS